MDEPDPIWTSTGHPKEGRDVSGESQEMAFWPR